MIRRVTNPKIANELVNDPLVRPTVGGDGYLDLSELIANRDNICLANKDGGAIFALVAPEKYEGHSFFRVRGREAIRLGRKIMKRMAKPGRVIVGATPVELRNARWFNRQIGFKSIGFSEGCELFEMRF